MNGCPTACSPALYNGLDKSGGMVDALDGAEYSGSLIILLNEGVSFVKRNMKTRWKKTANSRIEMPDYCERSVFEALVNALIHRDYLILGSEVHIDIYDDRLTITSPGGMADGTRIQERDIFNISSTAAIQSLLIFLAGWDIWSDREADFGKSRKPTMQPIITG